MPAIWLLGSSGFSAQLAGMLGLPFAFAHHFSGAGTVPALALYRQHFQRRPRSGSDELGTPSEALERPYAMVAVSVICAEDDERARYLAGPARLSMLRLRQGRPGPVPTLEEAAAYEYDEVERAVADQRFAGQAVGSPQTVRAQLTDLLERTRADELMLTTMVYDLADRVRSFELVTEHVAPHLSTVQ